MGGDSKTVLLQREFTDLQQGIDGVDLVYMTRIQQERFPSEEAYLRVKGRFVLTPGVLNAACKDEDRRRPVVMHPLPRLDELSKDLDTDDRAIYGRQAENGVYVRMALLALVLGADLTAH